MIAILGLSVLFTQTSVACICTKIFMPVCADGISFSNACEAECAGKKVWSQGPCEKVKKQAKPKITPTYKNKKKK